mmetsp:Transcript_126288/g.269403  ORF Transcript_126288/g.269403 Transcript_126288/m.269403 type:complete len:224 (-) Transcript_126288:381-1052(-)
MPLQCTGGAHPGALKVGKAPRAEESERQPGTGQGGCADAWGQRPINAFSSLSSDMSKPGGAPMAAKAAVIVAAFCDSSGTDPDEEFDCCRRCCGEATGRESTCGPWVQSGMLPEPASLEEASPSLASLCGGAALFTSIHFPRRRWFWYCSNDEATAVAPSWPGKKQTNPKPRERLVAGSIMTTASETTPNVSKCSRSSAAVVFCGRPPTKSLLVPGTARFVST